MRGNRLIRIITEVDEEGKPRKWVETSDELAAIRILRGFEEKRGRPLGSKTKRRRRARKKK